MRALRFCLVLLIGLSAEFPVHVQAQTMATCTTYLATNANPSGIPSVSGAGVAQRSAFLADGGKLVAIGDRYYTVSIPTAFYTATTPVLFFSLHGTGGYPEAEWSDWHASMAERGYAFISLSWGGGTSSAATDTDIYTQFKQILQDVGASCPIASASKWLMGFSVGSAMSFAVMIRDTADQKMFRGQIAISGAAIGPLTTGMNVMHSTVEANRTNANAVLANQAWMYCGEMDFDHTWSMCTEMPIGESFVNDHGGLATLYRDPSGEHHSLPTNITARNRMFDHVAAVSSLQTDALIAAQAACLFNWGEDLYPTLFSPKRATALTLSPYYYRYYSGTGAYLGISSDDHHLYYIGASTAGAVLDLGLAATWADQARCR